MATTQINLSVDSTLKADVEEVLAAIGLTPTEAIRMFLRQIAVRRQLPLSVSEREIKAEPLPILELSEEGYRNLACAINDSRHFEACLEKHRQTYKKFVREHNIEVRE